MSEERKKLMEEIKALIGTEFIYEMEDGVTLPAIVAAFDGEVGLTCLALELIDSDGTDHSDGLDENNNLCLIGLDADDEDFIEDVTICINSVKNGRYVLGSMGGVFGNPSCSF